MSKRKDIVQFLKEIKPVLMDNNNPTAIFIENNGEEKYRKLNICGLSVNEDYITVTTGKYLFKRKYRIKKEEI